jgi:hypothetical protein
MVGEAEQSRHRLHSAIPREEHMSKVERKGGIGRGVLALILGAAAARIATKSAEKIWTAGLHRDVPAMRREESMVEKAAWIALSAALVGVARELAKDLAAPKIEAA